jgi:hypothetical protein
MMRTDRADDIIQTIKAVGIHHTHDAPPIGEEIRDSQHKAQITMADQRTSIRGCYEE